MEYIEENIIAKESHQHSQDTKIEEESKNTSPSLLIHDSLPEKRSVRLDPNKNVGKEEKNEATGDHFPEVKENLKSFLGPSYDSPVCDTEQSKTTSKACLEKLKIPKRKGSIPVAVSILSEATHSKNSRRLSLQSQNQPDKEVDQCRKRLSNVVISTQHRRHIDTMDAEQKGPMKLNVLSLSPQPRDEKQRRSLSASRIPIQRSRSTPPTRPRSSTKPKTPMKDTYSEQEARGIGQNRRDLDVWKEKYESTTGGDLDMLDKEKPSLGDTKHFGKLKSGRKERGRAGPQGNGQDKRRASAAEVTSPVVGTPRARRSLSFSAGLGGTNTACVPSHNVIALSNQEELQEPFSKEAISAVGPLVKAGTGTAGSPADSLKTLNVELRDQVTRLRARLDAQRGSIRQVQWQKVLDVRQARQQEQQRLWTALEDLRQKLNQEKAREIEQMREHLTAKGESDLQKLTRHKDAEIFKLKQDLISKESILKRVLNEERKTRLGLTTDAHKTKLLNELKAVRQEKRALEDSLESASSAERAFSHGLRKHSERRESEVSKVRRDMQIEVKGLIEQLKNKDKLISQLEKDLGHQWVSAQQAALERAAVAACCDGVGEEEEEEEDQATLPGAAALCVGLGGQQQHQHQACSSSTSPYTLSSTSALPPQGTNQLDPTDFSSQTPSSIATTGSVEDVWSPSFEGFSLSKQDLQKALKGSKERNKELVEKCRAYLHRTKELTAQNRAYKDSSVKLLEENKKMQELLEHSKLRCLQLSRQASEASAEKTWAQHTTQIMEQARLELNEAHKTIAALKQACSDKDRRIELIQHRKKRRRLAGPEERTIGGETYFGYEEDANSVDSSLSRSTMSDEDVWDEVMSREETERNYQRLMMEHLQLQKSHTLLQTQTAQLQDPQREEKSKQALQEDLFQAQCTIEKLEMMLTDLGEGEVRTLLKEREILLSNLRASQRKIEGSEREARRHQQKLKEATARAEDLEFQLIEMEQQKEDNIKNSPCAEPRTPLCVDGSWDQAAAQHSRSLLTSGYPCQGGHTEREGGDGADNSECQSEGEEGDQSSATTDLRQLLDSLEHQQQKLQVTSLLGSTMEQLRSDLAALIKGKGKDADSVLKRFDNLTQEEKSRSEALEYMAHELQMKVINLQQEMDSPHRNQSQTKAKASKASKAENSMSDALAREKQENLELKAELKMRTHSENLLLVAEKQLQEELSNWKSQYECIKYQLDKHTEQQQPNPPVKTENSVQTSTNHLSPIKTLSPPLGELTRKNSKDRKSRPRSGDDPTATKRRRSSYEVCSENERPPPGPRLKSARSVGDLKCGSYLSSHCNSDNTLCNLKCMDDLQAMSQGLDGQDKENQDLTAVRKELVRIKTENSYLKDRLNQCAVEKSVEVEVDQGEQHVLLERISRLDADAGFLRMENETLKARLRQQRLNEDSSSESGSVDQMTEMEECVENLREQVEAREAAERQLRERLRHVESCAEEAEAAEMAARERYEDLLARETENSRQVRQMQQTCRELKDILGDKEIMEQGLTDKVDFLQRAEAAAVQRVDELEAENKDLRAQLQEAARLADDFDSAGSGGANQRELNKIQELKHQMTFLDTDNRALQARVAELEENEETLRENWRRVAEEDFSRIQNLDEKVKTLENLNRQLKVDLADAQEYFVINTVQETSLAAELAQSQSQLGPAPESGGEHVDTAEDRVDGEDVNLSGMVRKDSEKRTLRDKLKTLERQLSDVTEKKNTTIENLQEEIVGHKENEIKLSETISEMEMTEREIRAKLALYESSEVTVEKMLKYQSKIEELRTSQESLLDQLETLENQEMTLQEKKQEMERTLRGKIVTLEVEIKGSKTRELKDAARIRELEKQEKELSEKTAQQAEKENGLYVKISSLMEEAKTAKKQVETLREQLADKEDKVRKAKLLEVKFLEIEMEFGKKMSDLSSKLRHKEEELRQKEVAHEEEMSALKEESLTKDAENRKVVANLKEESIKKEKDLSLAIANLNEQIKEVSTERDAFESQVVHLSDQHHNLGSKQSELDNEILTLKAEVSRLNSCEAESQDMLNKLQVSLSTERELTEERENEVKCLKEELGDEKRKMAALENEIISMKSDLAEKTKNAEKSFEKVNGLESERKTMLNELKLKQERVNDLEKQLNQKSDYVMDLETKYEQLKSESERLQIRSSETETEHNGKVEELQKRLGFLEASMVTKEKEFEGETSSLVSKCEKLETEINSLMTDKAGSQNKISELENEIKEMEEKHALKVASLENEQKLLEDELKNKIMFLNTQLNQEVQSRETEKSALQDSSHREMSLSTEITKLQKEVETHKKELVAKLSELEGKNKEQCELSLQLSNLKHSSETLRNEFGAYKDMATEIEGKLRADLSERSTTVDRLNGDLDKAKRDLQQMEVELVQRENLVAEAGSKSNKLVEEKQMEISRLLEENTVKEQMVQEHMQKSESTVLQCQQKHQTELDGLRQQLREEEGRCQQLEDEKQTSNVRIEDLESQIQTLELYLSEVNFKLDSKSSQCRKREEELETALVDNDKNMRNVKELNEQLVHLKNQLEKKDAEVTLRATENLDSMSLVTSKQQELENARTELQKYLNEVEHHKNIIQNQEEEMTAKDKRHQELSLEFEKLSKQFQQRNTDYKHMESKVTGFELELIEADNRYREIDAKCGNLEMQLEEASAQIKHSGKVIEAKEVENQELNAEIKGLQEEINIKTKETDRLKEDINSKQRECEGLEAEITSFQREIVELNSANEQIKKQMHDYEKACMELEDVKIKLLKTEEELRLKLNIAEEELALSNQQLLEATERLQLVQETLEQKETSHKDTESGLKTLEQQFLEAKIENQSLKSKLTYSQEMNHRSQALYEKSEEHVKEIELALDQSRTELLKSQNILSEKETCINQMVSELENMEAHLYSSQEECKLCTEKVQDLEQQIEKLQMANVKISESEARVQESLSEKITLCNHLETRLKDKMEEVKQNEESIRQTNVQLDSLISEKRTLQEKNTALEERVNEAAFEKSSMETEYREKIDNLNTENSTLKVISDETINSLTSDHSQQVKTNQDLLNHVSNLESEILTSSSAISNLEQRVEQLISEKDQVLTKIDSSDKDKANLEADNTILNEKVKDLYAELETSRINLEVLHTKTDEKMKEQIDRNIQLEADISNLKEEIVIKQEEKCGLEELCSKHEKIVEDLKSKAKEHESQVEKHREERQTLESRLREAESMCRDLKSDLDTFKEEMSNSTQALSELEDQLQEKCSENELLQVQVQNFEKAVYNSKDSPQLEEQVISLQAELTKLDSHNKEQSYLFENQLKDIKAREHQMSHRVEELQGREKELLEQMADIEVTVIVPLETENQELKDEIGIVKQERDEAIAKSSRWDTENHGEKQGPENAHKCLEDALLQREELEKKVAILLDDITKLEAERDSMSKKLTDLHASAEEMAEKSEVLELEVERLKDLEKQTSVVEEAETRLMDQVLDLEERELQLSSELRVLRQKEVLSVGCQTVETENITDKLHYLEQKVEVLQDAESRYMDSIMELEEAKACLQAQLLENKNDNQAIDRAESSANRNPNASTFVTTYASISLQPASTEMEAPIINTIHKTSCNDIVERDDTNDMGSSFQKQNEKLVLELGEHYEKVQQLNLKVELLQDSEARLMERLLELEEESDSNKSSVPKEDHTTLLGDNGNQTLMFETKQKIETLKEENEFLAESVENYKKLYKDEKEKTNTLQERVLEDSSVFHELEEARAELSVLRCKMDNMQADHDRHMLDTQNHQYELSSLLEQKQQQVLELESREREVRKLNTELAEEKSNLQQQIFDLEERVSDLQLKEKNLQEEVHHLLDNESRMQHQLQDLQREVQEQRSGLEEEHSAQSDSGVSGNSHKTRYDNVEKKDARVRSPSPVIEESFNSKASISLSRPPIARSPPQIISSPASSAHKVTPSPAHITNRTSPSPAQSPTSHAQTPPPVAPPRTRGRRSRPQSIDSVSQEELVFLVEELQAREAVLKRRVLDLEAITDVALPHRVEELERENRQLLVTLEQSRRGISQHEENTRSRREEEEREVAYVSLTNPSYFYAGSDSNNNSSCSNNNRARREQVTMLDKPGEVLQQRIKELEHLDTINKNQLSELERDREVLHEIARKDKAVIHDLNVRIRELQLSERSLKEQVNSLEVSESSLFSRCEDLDAARTRLEDRVHELEVHERRLRELVRRLKLDEERWLGRSGGMETALGELSASESQLKRLLQDSEMEKGGLAERTAYMEARVRELEAVEASLAQKVKVLQSSEANLQKKLSQVENSEAAAHSKAGELDVLNADLSQRLQAGLEERAMLAQHVQQLHGQIQELDRRLLASRDSELAYKQHVESLQKNESSLQKRVREFELREIDSQARVRELEQTHDIMGDKMAALQRSENRLKYRVQELEGMGGQIPGELTPAQKQKVPQKLEDCQKRVVVLQNHVENLQLQLRENFKHSEKKLASREGAQTMSVPVSELSQLRTRSILLEEATYQMEEVERLNEELNNTVLKLREGKGASGHEVEVEVLKRRLASYKACIKKLKSSLSPGQATSLVDPEQDSGPDGETLPARHLRGLESERVLQSVRGLEEGKANGLPKSSSQGLAVQESPMVQSKAASSASSAPISLDLSFTEDSSAEVDHGKSSAKATPDQEESHWRAIEARRAGTVAGSPRGEGVTQPNSVLPKPVLDTGTDGGEVATTSTPLLSARGHEHGERIGGGVSTPEIEEVTVGLNLQSESELSSHHSHHNRTFETAQNDTDSSLSPVPPPRRTRKGAGSKGPTREAAKNSSRPHRSKDGDDGVANNNSSSNESGDGNISEAPYSSAGADVGTTNQKLFFGNGQKKPLPHEPASIDNNASIGPASPNKQSQAPLASFGGQDSFYLPSPTQDGDSFEDDDAPPPPLPTSQPPGSEVKGEGSGGSPSPTEGAVGARKDSLDTSTSGMSIRQRIAMIEKQLQSDQLDSKMDLDHELQWKTQASENLKQVELLEKDNKHLKEDINKLEKELEEKRRHINTLEIWLSSLDDLLKNKSKQTDREMVEQLQLDLAKLRSELKKVGYRPEGDQMDPAALRTELEHRDKEIVSKRTEVQTLVQELRRCKDECRTIEGMRRTALDSLRSLEQEVMGLQEKETQLTEALEELDELKSRFASQRQDLRQLLSDRTDLELTLQKTILERDHLKADLLETRGDRDGLAGRVEGAEARAEDLEGADTRCKTLEDRLDSLNELLIQRTEKTREVFEENLLLREKVHQGELELRRLRGLCDDFNNLSARYEELENHKQQAVEMLQPLQAQLERLARKCQQKDILLLELGDELKHNSFRQSRALDELERMEQGMNLEEYNTDFPQLTNGIVSQGSHLRRPYPSRSSSMEELDSHLNPLVTARGRRKRPTPYVNNRPRSADGILGSGGSDTESPTRYHHRHHHHLQQVAPFYLASQRTVGPESYGGNFRVIADYDPSLFSQSGRPGLELELIEGDVVTVTGPMDRTGYYEGEVKGRSGLVPANYLLPLQGESSSGILRRPVSSSGQRIAGGQSGDQSPEHILDMFKQLEQGAPAQQSQTSRTRGLPQDAWPPSHHQQQTAPIPDPPSNLHVREGDDGDGTYLLSWQPPKLDDRGCNNGVQVLGYMVYVDNQEYEQVPSAGLCQVLLEGFRPGHSHTLAVQALCAGGQASARAQLLFQGVVGGHSGRQGHDRELRQTDDKGLKDREEREHDTDLSSVLDKVHHKRGHKRRVLALYDYSPDQESPGDYPHLELAFQAGDVLTVYGEARPDGFLHGEIDGKKGLIPACFVEKISESHKGAQRVPTGGDGREMTV